jgi:hypothetical protein
MPVPAQRYIFLAITVLLTSGAATAQPSLDYQIPYSATVCHLEVSGEKYFAMDNLNSRCLIYNMDFSSYRTVSLALPQNYYMYDIRHVSQHLFNQDDLIEFAYIYSLYTETDTSWYYTYETRVINENGTQILKIPGAAYTEVVETQDQGRKLLVYIYDFSVLPATIQTQVYSLPEPATKSGTDPASPLYGLGDPWPNPAGGQVHVPLHLPPDSPGGVLVLYDLQGREVYRREVKPGEKTVSLPGGGLIPGTYLLHLQHGGLKTKSRKITFR